MSVAAKMSLRKAIKFKLRQLDSASIASQSKKVFDALKENKHFCNARSVALFMNMPKLEVETIPIIEFCFNHHKKVFLPKCSPPESSDAIMTFLEVGSSEEVNALTPAGKYNLREPSHGEDVFTSGRLDLIIVPGVAFTKHGDRLGHGAGYYDKFLSEFKSRFDRIPYLIGVCLAEQLVSDLPTEHHDWKMDQVIAPLLK